MSVSLRRWTKPDGTIRESWTASFYAEDGSRHRRKGFSTQAEAQAWVDQQRQALAVKAALAPPHASTISELLDLWIAHCRKGDALEPPKAPQTVENYARITEKHVRTHIGSMPLADFTAPMARALANKIQETSGTAVGPRTLRYLSIAFSFGVRQGIMPFNPLLNLRLFRTRPEDRALKADRLPSRAEVKAINDHLIGLARDNPDRWLRFTTLFRLLAASGLRIGEALALRWSDWTPEPSTLHVRRSVDDKGRFKPTKTQAGRRDVVLSEDVSRWLYRWREHAAHKGEDDLIFATRDGRVISRHNLYTRFWVPVSLQLGLTKPTPRTKREGALAPRFAFHGFRHYRISEMLAAGMDLKLAMDQAGHVSASMTQDVYRHVLPEERNAVRTQSERIAQSLALPDMPEENLLRRKRGRPRKVRGPVVDDAALGQTMAERLKTT